MENPVGRLTFSTVHFTGAFKKKRQQWAMLKDVAEEEQLLAACILAGTKYGSREELQAMKQHEEVLQHKCDPPNVEGWLASTAEPTQTDHDISPRRSERRTRRGTEQGRITQRCSNGPAKQVLL